MCACVELHLVLKFSLFELNQGPSKMLSVNSSSTLNSTIPVRNDKLPHVTPCGNHDALLFFWVSSFFLSGVLGAIGNFLVILIVWKNRSMRNPTNFLLTSITASDFIYLSVNTPFEVMDLLGTKYFAAELQTRMFLVPKVFSPFSTIISTYALTLLAVERYNALLHPLKIHRRLNKRSAKIAICLIISLSFVIPVYGWLGRKDSASYTRTLYLTLVVIPGAVVAFCYGRIILGVYVFKTICSQGTAGAPQAMKEKKNLVKMLSLLAMIFLVPKLMQLSYFWYTLLSTAPYTRVICALYITWLQQYLTRCLNPVIYMVYCSNYREGAKRLFRSCLSR